jgi:hypothetical protein
MSPARIVVAGIVVASAVSVVSLLFGVRERRRQGDGWVRAVILVVTHAIAGVCLITPGFVLEPALWALFNDGVIGMWEVLGSSTTGFSALK